MLWGVAIEIKRRKHVRTPPTGHEFPIGVALVLKLYFRLSPPHPPLSVYSEWEQCLTLTFKSNADVQTANDSLLETKFLNGKGGLEGIMCT